MKLQIVIRGGKVIITTVHQPSKIQKVYANSENKLKYRKNTLIVSITGENLYRVIINDCTIVVGVGGLVECAASFIT
jgi:mRNA-degrading endonuclease HigB of HigAB toxin-antitoxin module